MAVLKVNISGFEEVIRRIKEVQSVLPGGPVGKKIGGHLKLALGFVEKETMDVLRKETPAANPTRPDFHSTSRFHRGRTQLRDSWKWKLKITNTKIEGGAYLPTAKLGKLVDLLQAGSPAHVFSKPEGVMVFYVKSGGGWKKVFTKILKHPGFAPNPFLERAKERQKKYLEHIKDAVMVDFHRILSGR
jgi:hypothetical protein